MLLMQFVHPTLAPDDPAAVLVHCPACNRYEVWALDELRDHGLCRSQAAPCLMCQPPKLRVEAWTVWDKRLYGPNEVFEGPSALTDCDTWAEQVLADAERELRSCEVYGVVHAHPPMAHCQCLTRRLAAYDAPL